MLRKQTPFGACVLGEGRKREYGIERRNVSAMRTTTQKWIRIFGRRLCWKRLIFSDSEGKCAERKDINRHR